MKAKTHGAIFDLSETCAMKTGALKENPWRIELAPRDFPLRSTHGAWRAGSATRSWDTGDVRPSSPRFRFASLAP
jgi:hypothetical protein